MEADFIAHQLYQESKEKKIAQLMTQFAATLPNMIHLDQATVKILRDYFYKHPMLALVYYHCCSTDPCATVFNDELGMNADTSAIWSRISNIIGDPIRQEESNICHQAFKDLVQLHAKIDACASYCKHLLSLDGKEGLVEMSINDLPSAFHLTNDQKQQLISLFHDIVINHVQVLQHKDQLYHLNLDLMFDMGNIVLCPGCARAKDPLSKDQESIAAGNDYGWLGSLKLLNGTTRNACTPILLYNIDLQI